METTKAIIAKNVKNLVAVINGHVESATIAGIEAFRVDFIGFKFRFEVGSISVYADEIEVLGCVAHLKSGGIVFASISLMEE